MFHCCTVFHYLFPLTFSYYSRRIPNLFLSFVPVYLGGVCCIIVEALAGTGCMMFVVSVPLGWVVALVCSIDGAGFPKERSFSPVYIALVESAMPWPPQTRAADSLSDFFLSVFLAGYLHGYSYVETKHGESHGHAACYHGESHGHVVHCHVEYYFS